MKFKNLFFFIIIIIILFNKLISIKFYIINRLKYLIFKFEL